MQISNSYDYQSNPATKDTPWIRRTFIAIAVLFMIVMLVIPLLAVFYEAFKNGWQL
ncbi:sulfate ABC transporter permease subunit CysW, partial [Psychrobacter sp. 1U2]